MKEEKNTDRKTNGNANMPFDTSDFIRQVSLAGSREDMPKPMQTDSQTEMSKDTSESIDSNSGRKLKKNKKLKIKRLEH